MYKRFQYPITSSLNSITYNIFTGGFRLFWSERRNWSSKKDCIIKIIAIYRTFWFKYRQFIKSHKVILTLNNKTYNTSNKILRMKRNLKLFAGLQKKVLKFVHILEIKVAKYLKMKQSQILEKLNSIQR